MKNFLLAIFAVFFFNLALNAQSDGFFRGGSSNETTRDPLAEDYGINNYGIGETVPLGNGLLILIGAGAGYVVARRKHMSKKYISLLVACFILFTFTNCKKKVPTVTNVDAPSVYITLNMDNGSRVIVDPTNGGANDYASVTFELNDTIYVGNNGLYCGKLVYDGEKFAGTITPTSADNTDYLHFYFMGNKTPKNKTIEIIDKKEVIQLSNMKPVVNNTEQISVLITDQTSKYPVISYARSNIMYTSKISRYSARLQNKCAIVKFNITNDNIPASNAVSITGMKNLVTVNFAANNYAKEGGSAIGEPYAYSMYGEGDITLHPEGEDGAHERWAILLSQAAVTNAGASGPGSFTRVLFSVDAINANDYKPDGIDVTLFTPNPGAFCINKNYDQVFFAPGNLQYTRTSTSVDWSTGSWSFMPNQTDYDPTANTSIDVVKDYNNNYMTSISHFGWGTSGYHDSNDTYNVNYHPWCTTWDTIDRTYKINTYGYGPSLNMTTSYDLTGTSANYDWGMYNAIYNPVTNTTDPAGTWHTPSSKDMVFILGPNISIAPVYDGSSPNARRSATVNGVPNARYAKAFLFGQIHGLIIFPDGYKHPDGLRGPDYINVMNVEAAWNANQYNSDEWNSMQTAGAVFLPAAGCHETYKNGRVAIHSISNYCYYWTSSAAGSDGTRAKNVRVSNTDMVPDSYAHRARGSSVRLVRPASSPSSK